MWATAAAAGLSLIHGIEIVVVLVVVAAAVVLIAWRFRRPTWRIRRVPRWARRNRRIQEAAAADVAAMRKGVKYFRRDAPGDHQDEL